uniref:14-3-3 domain-containing protein n=1 Tax=Ciona intestinalis TaxID=7719 RepID=F6S1R7_CIOIN
IGDMSEARENLYLQASLAEATERYGDMAEFMKEMVQLWGLPTEEERNLLSVSFKNLVAQKRCAWRVLNTIGINCKHDKDNKLGHTYRETVALELKDICTEVTQMISNTLLDLCNSEENIENKVFYLKMKGDYLRYITEVLEEDEKKSVVEDADTAYKEALKSAEKLPNSHPIKLGLALNYSVFQYEILKNEKTACALAKQGLDDAVEELNNHNENVFNDSELIMQLLQDNLSV